MINLLIYVCYFLFFFEYSKILVGDNKRHHAPKVLNCKCSYLLIDDYIKYNLSRPTKVIFSQLWPSICN
jgi:hypothetical protein